LEKGSILRRMTNGRATIEHAVLSGSRLTHFERFFHEGPPDRGLKVGKGTTLSE
jgi:hypothetical protein